jgi:diguanylate cyclase (GGDEF)-like protein
VATSAGAMAAIITAVIFWNTSSRPVIAVWTCIYLVIYAIRNFLIYRYNAAAAETRNHRRDFQIHLLFSAIVGLAWSAISIYLLAAEDLASSIVIILILGGIIAGTVATNTAKLSAFFAFSLPIAIPVVLFLLSIILAVFCLFISFSAYRLNKLVIESLAYQFDNLQLLNELEQEKNQVTRLYSNLEFDLSRRKKAEEQLKVEKEKAEQLAQSLLAISTLDGLTGIPNRRHFDSVIAKEWNRATRAGTPVSLIMCDIDHFKTYNDNYGHQKGDNCLIQIATLLQDHARRDGDLAARYGGEEFVIVLPTTSLDSAREVAEQMRKGIENLGIAHRYSDTNNIVTASFGVSTMVPQRDQQPRLLIARADKAMYAAKQAGRNRVVAQTPELYIDNSTESGEEYA